MAAPLSEAEPRALQGAAACAEAVVELIEGARRELLLATPDLAPSVYDEPALVESLRAWLLGNRRRRLQVLVWDAAAARGSVRLMALAQQLSSAVELRVPAPAQLGERAHFIVADGVHVLERTLSARAQGRLYLHAPRRARAQRERFEALWAPALPAAELRRLHI